MCIMCTWACLEAPLNFLMLQLSWSLFFFIFRPFISLDFSTQSKFNPSFFWKYAPRSGRKHNSWDRHTPTWTLKLHCWLLRMHYWKHLGTVFRILTLPSGKAWLQKTIVKCILFLQFSCLRLALAALADKSFISSSMVIIFSRFFHTAFKFCCIPIRHETKFLKIWFPPSLGSIMLSAAAKEFLFKGFFLGPDPVRLPLLKTPLDLQKVMVKPGVFQHFHFSDPLGSSMHQNCLFI